MFCSRVRKYVGAYVAAQEKTDAVIFSGGIGENSAEIRKRICLGLGNLGMELDSDANDTLPAGGAGKISTASSRRAIYVIPTNEELMIARDTFTVVEGGKPV